VVGKRRCGRAGLGRSWAAHDDFVGGVAYAVVAGGLTNGKYADTESEPEG